MLPGSPSPHQPRGARRSHCAPGEALSPPSAVHHSRAPRPVRYRRRSSWNRSARRSRPGSRDRPGGVDIGGLQARGRECAGDSAEGTIDQEQRHLDQCEAATTGKGVFLNVGFLTHGNILQCSPRSNRPRRLRLAQAATPARDIA